LKAGLSHDEFWGLTPKETYLSIKAYKSRQDHHYQQLALFVSVLANVAGSGPKKPIRADQLYTPQLTQQKDRTKPIPTDDSWKDAAQQLMDELTSAPEEVTPDA
jgi:hypothetical protein